MCLFDRQQACSVIRRKWRWRVATLSVHSVDVYAELATRSEHLQFFNAISCYLLQALQGYNMAVE